MSGIVLVLLIGAISLWVLVDARARAGQGRPVVVTLLGISVERPEVWATLCLLVAIVFLPMYLVARSVD